MASNHSLINLGYEAGLIRQLYSVKKERLGITLRPAKKESPSSITEFIT